MEMDGYLVDIIHFHPKSLNGAVLRVFWLSDFYLRVITI
jgi:hypothetical protein